MLNLTQHKATQEQINAGVKDLPEQYRTELIKLLTIEELPTVRELKQRAIDIYNMFLVATVMSPETEVLIGGAPYLLPYLTGQFKAGKIKCFHAFSRRESVETTQPDGAVIKTNVFKHVGFIED
jgi:hypothetical protein